MPFASTHTNDVFSATPNLQETVQQLPNATSSSTPPTAIVDIPVVPILDYSNQNTLVDSPMESISEPAARDNLRVEEDTTDDVPSTPLPAPSAVELRPRRAPVPPRRYEPESGLWV